MNEERIIAVMELYDVDFGRAETILEIATITGVGGWRDIHGVWHEGPSVADVTQAKRVIDKLVERGWESR